MLLLSTTLLSTIFFKIQLGSQSLSLQESEPYLYALGYNRRYPTVSCEYKRNVQKENNLDGNDLLCMTVVLLWSWANVFFSHSSEGPVGRSSSSQMEQYYSCPLESGKALDPLSKTSTVPSLIFLLFFYFQMNCINRHLKDRSVGLFLSLVNFLRTTDFITQGAPCRFRTQRYVHVQYSTLFPFELSMNKNPRANSDRLVNSRATSIILTVNYHLLWWDPY